MQLSPRSIVAATGLSALLLTTYAAFAEDAPPAVGATSYLPVNTTEPFAKVMARMSGAKASVQKAHQAVLDERYDLSSKPAAGVKMSGGKAVQSGVRVKLAKGTTWAQLAEMPPADIKSKNLWPSGFYPLPHPNMADGGMLFPKVVIDETKKQTDRDLQRFDLDFDIPDAFLPEFPPPLFLTTRKDLGDVSKGQLVTLSNYFELFDGILNAKQLDGVRLLVTPFPQQQFNATDDRRSAKPSQGVACFDCHVNGHTSAATHLVGDIRPQEFRHRIDTPSLRGVNVQTLFGSQRALKTVEDFTEFEQRAAYFDGDLATAAKKGVNPLDRGSQVHAMAEFQELLDFPPAPKLDLLGRLNSLASAEEKRGEEIFRGKGQCAACHTGVYFTDGSMHDLQTERFFAPKMINGRYANMDGPIKTFPLRGIKDSPPYLHDDRLLTLEDTVEFFNLVLATKLTDTEKSDLVAYLRVL